MTLVQYLIAVFVAFSGVLVGAFLACSAREEMPTARKYFPLIQAVLFAAVAAFALDYFSVSLLLRIAAYVALFPFLLFWKFDFYPFLAVFFFLLAHSSQSLFAVSVLVFLYGFPAGSLFVVRKNEWRIVRAILMVGRRYSYFVFVAVALEALYLVRTVL